MRPVIFFFVLVFLSLNTYAKGGNEHLQDMYDVFPFVRSQQITTWFMKINDVIDKTDGEYLYTRLRESPHQHFTRKRFSHRILFHWGYNCKPWNLALDSCVIGWNPELIYSFQQKLVAEQKQRNHEINKLTEQTFGLATGGAQAKYSNALASIAYNIHLLGDYSTTDTYPLEDIKTIFEDIYASIKKLDNGVLGANYIAELKRQIKSVSIGESSKARKMLQTLKQTFPTFLEEANSGWFKRVFEKKGIIFK